MPFCWQPRARDVPLDLLRGLAMVILVVNHLHLDSPLKDVTGAVLSAAEALVAVSGVVVGMVFGRRWLTLGARATSRMLLERSRKLYLASVVVVSLVGLLTLVPGLPTDRLTVSGNVFPPQSSYAFDGLARTLLAVVVLEAGPWQFNILGFFIVVLALAPALLWALQRGWWPAVLAGSWALYAVGRALALDVLPSQSERPFPLLVWQLLFVHGVALGWHRQDVGRLLRRVPAVWFAAAVVAAAAAALQLLAARTGGGWAAWEAAHFEKAPLDPARVIGMSALVLCTYFALTRCGPALQRRLGAVLLPFGRNSFYVFIMHVFVCLAVATVLPGQGLGLTGNALVQVACLALLWTMVRREFLFRWVPR